MHRDLWLSLFSAVAGTVIGYLAAIFRPEARVHWAIVLALVLGLLVCLAMLGPLRQILSSLGQMRLHGEWRTAWAYAVATDNGVERVEVVDHLSIRQMGRYFSGRAESVMPQSGRRTPIDPYEVVGTVSPEGIVEGRWRQLGQVNPYRGVFHGVLEMGSGRVHAEWIGHTGQHARVVRDSWIWSSPRALPG
ncbi:MAG: hypothetical protein ABI779_18545 [Acidobacteriota bacterium]